MLIDYFSFYLTFGYQATNYYIVEGSVFEIDS